MFLHLSLPSVFEILSEVMQCYLFYQALFKYTHTKNREFAKVATFVKSILLTFLIFLRKNANFANF